MDAMARLSAIVAIWLLPSMLLAQQRLRIAEGVIVAGVAVEIAMHGFDRLDSAADALENAMPAALTYNRWGDPITWVQHAAWAAGAAAGGALVARVVGVPARKGACDFATIAAAFYTVRELVSALGDHESLYGPFRDQRQHGPTAANGWAPQRGLHVGWAVDGIGDVAGPITIRSLAC